MKKVAVLIIVLLSIFLLSTFALFHFKKAKEFDFKTSLWIHHTGEPANTLEGLKNSLAKGFKGIECDVFFDKESGRFILSHDWPPQKDFIHLDDIMAHEMNTETLIWIDLKNADLKEAFALIKSLKKLENKYNFKNRYFVESRNPGHQILLSWNDIPTVFWLQDYKKSRLSWLRKQQDKLTVAFGNFIAVSAPYEVYQEFANQYKNQPKLVFTVNSEEIKSALLNDQTVKVILTDNLTNFVSD